MEVFDFDDYKAFLRAILKKMPKHGHGESRKLSLYLGVNSVVVSQVMSGDKDFTIDQALKTAVYFGLQEPEQEFFVLLVSRERAATPDLKRHYTSRIETLRKESLKLKQAVPSRELGEHEKSIFYSNWFYSGVRVLTSIEGKNTADAIAEHFGLSRTKVHQILAFLKSVGLVKEENGRYGVGVASTYLDSTSPFVNGHRRNWRLKAMEKFTEPMEMDLFYSNPHTISLKDFEKTRKELAEFIKAYSQRISASDPATTACLNLDYFTF